MNENLIDRYLLNLLSSKEKKAFESRLKIDEALVIELEQQKAIFKDIEGLGRIELKSKLKDYHREFFLDPPKPKSKFRKLFFKLASAAVFIGVISTCWIWFNKAPTTSELFAQNFKSYDLSLNERSEGDLALKKIENLYADGNFSEAIPLFKHALDASPVKSSQLLLGLGISYLQTEQPKEAIEQFKFILANKDFNYEDEAQWYLGLSYLKLDNIKDAKKHFEILASDNSKDHHDAAIQLLNDINDN